MTINQASYLALIDNYSNSNKSTRLIVKSGKSPEVCFLLAFFPGFFIHGLGHYYIGDYWNGTYLFLGGTLSLGLGYVYLLGAAISDNGLSSSSGTVFYCCAGVFLYTWFYDWIVATKKAKKMQESQSVMIYPSIKQKQVSINFAFSIK